MANHSRTLVAYLTLSHKVRVYKKSDYKSIEKQSRPPGMAGATRVVCSASILQGRGGYADADDQAASHSCD